MQIDSTGGNINRTGDSANSNGGFTIGQLVGDRHTPEYGVRGTAWPVGDLSDTAYVTLGNLPLAKAEVGDSLGVYMGDGQPAVQTIMSNSGGLLPKL